MPHGHCYMWEPFILYSEVISHMLHFIVYLVLSVSLFKFTLIGSNFFGFVKPTIFLFSIFIFTCALTHLMDL